MRLTNCEYVGLDDCFSRVKIEGVIKGRNVTGFMLCENDGRDIDFESEDFNPEDVDMEELWADDHSIKLLEPELQKGMEEYDK